MARTLDLLGYRLGRLGWAGMAGGLLLAASTAWWQFGVKPLEAQAAAQRDDNARVRSVMQAEAARAVQDGVATAERPVLAPAAAAALRRLFDAAGRAGLQLDQGEYRLTEVGSAHLRRYQLSLPVAGSYPAIRAFIMQAINDDPALALVAVRLRRERIEVTDLDAVLNFTLYLGDGA